MAIELYWGSGSPFAWRVMLALEAKRLPYESKLLEFSKGDHKSPEFLKLNPRGKVPCLKDGDFVLYESLAMMAYLDRKYSEPPLFGKSPEETGLIWRAISECEYLTSAGDKVIRPVFFGKGLDKVDEIKEAAQKIRDELKRLDEQLVSASWLVGEDMSAADIAVFPLVQLCLRAAAKDAAKPFDLRIAPLAEYFPSVTKWVRQIETLPYYERTYPPHWRQ
ncbi:MAG: glutathione S-transferase family protein [Deltaproteobacteria bacterium]|nr:glutathione S-transferase family protein [Deltaproteobacteria bacterium]MBM4299421.1 glutathione S-transferase family protein [Deltaproteobacteria bacterium]